MIATRKPDVDFRQMQAGVEALAEGFALFDERDELVFCNKAFRALYPDLAIFLTPGTSWPVFMVEAIRRYSAVEFDQLDAHLSSGIDAPLILEACERGNRWCRMAIHPVDSGGFVLTESDVTDQHQAHEIIEHADDLLRDILDACASRIVLSRLSDGKILYRTPAWKADFGNTQHIQDTFTDMLDYSDVLADLLPVGRLDHHECILSDVERRPYPARLSARMIDYQGESAIVLSTEDMSQLYSQRDEILRINQRLLDAIEALDQGFALFDEEHRLLMANQHYLDVNRPIAESLVAGETNNAIVERAVACGHEPLAAGWLRIENDDGYTQRKGLETDNANYEFELESGQTFSVSRQGTSDGGFVIAWRDVTEQRNTENELSKRREESFQNEKLTAMGQLLAGVAHELNNPLSVVVGHAMMLRDEIDDPEALDGINKISRSAQRCAKIVKTFLAMARQRPGEMTQVELNDVLQDSLEIASFSLKKTGIDLQLNLGDKLPMVEMDETQITQVFINLMVNAEHALSKATQKPVLRITTFYESTANRLVARISDNGPGISSSLRSRIFEPFFTTKAVDEGTGVGLALSHRIVSSHHGSLELVDSELGGATFEVSLPATSSIKKSKIKEKYPSANLSHTALIIDDEPDVSNVMAKLLKSMGVQATVADSAEQGLRLLDTGHSFDIILCDLKMPDIDGLEMFEMIVDRWPSLRERFVFVTGDAISEAAEYSRRMATHPVLEKPVSTAELSELIHHITRRVKSGTSLEEKL